MLRKISPLHFNLFLFVILIVFLISSYLNFFTFYFWHILLLSIGVLATLPVVISAFKALENRKVSVDLLAAVALLVSLIKGEWMSVLFINLMITSARIFGIYTENRARYAIKGLLKLRPQKVKIKIGNRIVEVSLSNVKVGDLVVIEAGDRIPVDGVIVEGVGSVDQSSLTGESIPIVKKAKDRVFSSTLNVSGSFLVKADKVGKDTTFERIISLVEEARSVKVGIQTIADRFSAFYIIATLIGSICIYIIFGDVALVLSVLLVTCADDIAVAIPLTFWAAIGYAARRGIIIKGADFLESLAGIKRLILDKTGTLTRKKIKVEKVIAFGNNSADRIISLSASLESISEHPLAGAIVEFAKEKGLRFKAPENFEEVTGKGIAALYGGEKILVGKLDFLKENHIKVSKKELIYLEDLEKEGYMVICLAKGERIIGLISLVDEIKPRVRETIDAFARLGVTDIVMLTGDNEAVASRVAKEAGIKSFYANLMPQDKLDFIKKSLNKNYKVAMVGDGVNDAAALAASDVGIAMGAIGSDAAIEAADIALMQDKFVKVLEAFVIGKYALKIAKENFLIWGLVNAVGLVLVFGRVFGPQGAAAYNFFTDFLPLINSVRIFWYRFFPKFNVVSSKVR